MVISFLISSMCVGGTERVTHDLINELTKRGYKVNLFCLVLEGEFLKDLLIPKDNIYKIGGAFNLREYFIVLNKLKKLLKTTKTTTLIGMGEYPNIIVPLVKFKGKKIIVEHNIKTFYTSPESYVLNNGLKKIVKFSYEKADEILCVSQNIKDILIQKNPSFSKNTHVIYNPIDFEKIQRMALEKIQYNTNKIKIINVGRLTGQKNIPLLLHAFSKIHKEFNNTELWLVGDGTIRNELENLTKTLQLTDSVIFWNYQDNPYKFISKADFLVSSSDFEGFHLVVFETLFLKKRIVTTRSISDFDNIITNDLGVVVPVKDENSLINAIREEIINKKIIKETPELLQNFSIKKVTDHYLTFIK